MSNILQKTESVPTDGFSCVDEYEDAREQSDGGVIKGLLVRFSNDAAWIANDEELAADVEWIAIDIVRVIQKWQDGKPVETIVLDPNQRIPDTKKMNDAVPQQWEEGPDGKPRGPWQLQRLLYLLNPHDMSRATYATGTVGGEIALRELADRTRWTRRIRGAHVYPVVRLSDTYMKTRFGGRQRPHFIIVRWVDLGGDLALPAPEPPTPPAITEAPAPVEQTKPATPEPAKTPEAPPTAPAPKMRVVSAPSLAEHMGDQIPFKAGDVDASGRCAASTSPTRRNASKNRKAGPDKDALSEILDK